MQHAFSSSSHVPESSSVTPTSDSGLIGFNSPVLPLSDASQAEIDRLLRQSPKKSRFLNRKAPKSATGAFAQPPIIDTTSSSQAAADLVPNTSGMLTPFSKSIDSVSMNLDEDEEPGDDALRAIESDSELQDEEDRFDDTGEFPEKPTRAKPGSENKVIVLAARYAAAMPLWHNDDATDHGPTRKSDELLERENAKMTNTTQPKTAVREGK